MRRRKLDDALGAGLAIIALLAFIVGAFVVWTQAPCGLWKYHKAGEIPARCISHIEP